MVTCMFSNTGQFMGSKVQIDEQAGLMKVGNRRVPFPVKKGEIWPYLKIPGTCWYPTETDDQGEGVLQGIYTEYIVDDLFCHQIQIQQVKINSMITDFIILEIYSLVI